MMRRILDIFGAFERDLIRARTRAALAVKRAKGLKFGSTAPYGYRINGDRLDPEVGERRGGQAAGRIKVIFDLAVAEVGQGAGDREGLPQQVAQRGDFYSARR